MASLRAPSVAIGFVVGLAVVVYAATDSAAVENLCYFGLMGGASLGAWIGAARASRGRRLVPLLIAAGVTLTMLGDLLYSVVESLGLGTDVSVADAPWFASYVLLCAALWVVLGRSGSGSRLDLDLVIDAATIMVVTVLIFWSISVDSIIADDSVTPMVRVVWAAYPIADAVLLALVVRALLSRSARTAIGLPFALGVSLWLTADIAYLYAPEGETLLIMMDAAWMVAPVLIAHAAWRVRDVAADAAGSLAAGGWVAPLIIAVGPLIVPPALEIIADLRGEPDRPLRMFVGMAALIALAFVRTARLLRSEARAHHELEVARDAALEASRAKSMFLANMSHEIRTPLTTVLATGELLEDTPLNDVQHTLLAKMNRSGNLLMSLVEGVLDFSRVEAGQVNVRSVEFDLHTLVTDAADVLAPRACQAGIRFELDLDPEVPRTVLGDPTRLAQVVGNLLDNALKFTHQGGVRLVVRPAGGHHVELRVEDTGIGIREVDLASVFDTFRQVDGSTTRRYGGSGLGLAICKELTELMGGSLTVQSQFGAGSTFVTRIPLPGTPEQVPTTPSPVAEAVAL